MASGYVYTEKVFAPRLAIVFTYYFKLGGIVVDRSCTAERDLVGSRLSERENPLRHEMNPLIGVTIIQMAA